jgi:hypothetical protein
MKAAAARTRRKQAIIAMTMIQIPRRTKLIRIPSIQMKKMKAIRKKVAMMTKAAEPKLLTGRKTKTRDRYGLE